MPRKTEGLDKDALKNVKNNLNESSRDKLTVLLFLNILKLWKQPVLTT